MFVESYGRVAVEDARRGSPPCSTGAPRSCGPAASPRAAPSSPRRPSAGSAGWRTPPCSRGSGSTASGGYNQLVKSDRLTLTGAFKRAGWRAVGAMPANQRAWPEGSSFYGYDKVYDRRNVGYRGPGFGVPSMPDQYTLEALHRLELAARDRPPLFAEVDLHLQPRAVDAHPAAGPLGRRRRRLDLRPHPGGGVHARLALRRLRPGSRRLRALDRVLHEHARLVRAALRRRQTGGRRPRRPSARDDRHRPGREPRRADLGDRPRPEGDAPDRRMGLAGRHAAEPAARRSGRWARSATAS